MEDLRIKDLSFQYAGTQEYALKEINLTIKKGTIILLCGASGSGKSTLLKLLKPQIKPAGTLTGQCLLNQVPLDELPTLLTSSKIGWVGQNPDTQFVTDNVWDELAFGLENLRLSAIEIMNRIGELATFLNMTHLMDKKVSDLSGGEKQLVHLAAVLVMRPTLLLLDEPTAQLDPQAAQQIIALLLRLNRELGITLMIVEHQLTGFFKEADQIVLLDQGRPSLTGTPSTFIQNLEKEELVHQRFVAELPTAVQLYVKNRINQKQYGVIPITVIEGKFFLAKMIKATKQTVNFITEQQPAKKQEIAIQLKNGWFRYDKHAEDSLAGVFLNVYKGELLAVVGGNGSGKTTLLKILARIHTCYAGKLLFFGKSSKKSSTKIAYLPQNPNLLFIKDTVMEDYQEALNMTNHPPEVLAQKIAEVTARLDLSELLHQHPLDLSAGQLQRVALGKLLLQDPAILLLDEPTKGIDRFTIQQMTNELRCLVAEGKTILCVTHDLDFAAEASDRCCLFFNHQLFPVEASSVFFSQNQFYTTEASRIAKDWYPEVVTVTELLGLCKQLEEKR